MIEEKALVISSDSGIARVRAQRNTACGGCSLNKGCGVSVLDRYMGDRGATMEVIDPVAARPGDEVVIGIREDALVKGSIALYIVPLLAMILAAIAGSAVVAPWLNVSAEGASILFGALGLVAGLGWTAVFSRRIQRDTDYQPVILRVTGHDSLPERFIPITKV